MKDITTKRQTGNNKQYVTCIVIHAPNLVITTNRQTVRDMHSNTRAKPRYYNQKMPCFKNPLEFVFCTVLVSPAAVFSVVTRRT